MTPTMPIYMPGSSATVIVQGDFHDHGSLYNVQGTGQGNCSLCLLPGIETNLIYNLRIVAISQIEYVYVPPHPLSPRFTGQEIYLAKLREYFQLPTEGRSGRRSFLLYGMGGIGKTQIALKFAEENADR